MKFIRLALFSLILSLVSWQSSEATLRIVTTTPELADITRQVGGPFVRVESLAKGSEDIHAVPQRPSFVPKLNQADGVILVGLEMEHAFLPALLEVAQNPKILRDRPGYIDCSDGVTRLEVPTNLSRSEGELHPLGNPHYTVDPRYGGLIADNIAKGLSRLDPAHQADYARNRDAFKTQWHAKLKEWDAMIRPLKGVKAVSHHKDMAYLADFTGLDIVDTVELKPGIAPTPTHLEELANRMKSDQVRLIIREIQYSDKTARWLSEQTGAKIAAIATMGSAFPDASDYFGFVEHNLTALVDAVKSGATKQP